MLCDAGGQSAIIFAGEIRRLVSGPLEIIRTASPAVTSAPPLLRRQTRSNCAGAIPRETSTVVGGLWSRYLIMSGPSRGGRQRHPWRSFALRRLQ